MTGVGGLDVEAYHHPACANRPIERIGGAGTGDARRRCLACKKRRQARVAKGDGMAISGGYAEAETGRGRDAAAAAIISLRCGDRAAKPLFDSKVVPRRFCDVLILARFPAEPPAPMMMDEKTKFSAAMGATVVGCFHQAIPLN
jgi:hypothetical protein